MTFGRMLMIMMVVVLGLGLGSCDELDDALPLKQEKGVYQGAPDTPISDEQREQLRQRIRQQAG